MVCLSAAKVNAIITSYSKLHYYRHCKLQITEKFTSQYHMLQLVLVT